MVDQAKPVIVADVVKPSLSILFSRPYQAPVDPDTKDAKDTRKTVSLADAAIAGLIPTLPNLLVSGFGLALIRETHTLACYMPAGGVKWDRRTHIAPRMMACNKPYTDKRGTRHEVNEEATPQAIADLDRLSQAVVAAWLSVPDGQRFDREIPLSL